MSEDSGTKEQAEEKWIPVCDHTLKFDTVELQKINLGPNDVLSVKLTGDAFDVDNVQSLQDHLSRIFTKNKVMVFNLPSGNDMNFEVISPDTGCSNVCSDCDCGKKE